MNNYIDGKPYLKNIEIFRPPNIPLSFDFRVDLSNNPLEIKFTDLFNGELQKYKWETGYPNTYQDSHAQWTHISGFCFASTFSEFILTVQHQLLINGYPDTLTIRFNLVDNLKKEIK